MLGDDGGHLLGATTVYGDGGGGFSGWCQVAGVAMWRERRKIESKVRVKRGKNLYHILF